VQLCFTAEFGKERRARPLYPAENVNESYASGIRKFVEMMDSLFDVDGATAQ